MAPRKAFIHKKYVNAFVSGSFILLQSVDQFFKFAYEILSALLYKFLRLFNVDFHIKFIIQECHLYVHLMHLQAYGCPSRFPNDYHVCMFFGIAECGFSIISQAVCVTYLDT